MSVLEQILSTKEGRMKLAMSMIHPLRDAGQDYIDGRPILPPGSRLWNGGRPSIHDRIAESMVQPLPDGAIPIYKG